MDPAWLALLNALPRITYLVNRCLRWWRKEPVMGFVQPAFNLPCQLWHNPTTPLGIADLHFNANLSPGRLVSMWIGDSGGFLNPLGVMLLRCPRGLDIRDQYSGGTAADIVEVPEYSGRYYNVAYVDDIGLGFANEHRLAEIWKWGVWPAPIPSGGGPFPPPPPPPPPPANPGNYNTGGIPANALPAAFALAVPSVVHALLCWEGNPLLMQPVSALAGGPVFGTVQTNLIGGVAYNSVAITYGPLAAGAYPEVWTFPALGIGQIQVIYLAFPGAAGITNGINSGIGALILAGATALTAVAPNPVIFGGLEITPTGPSGPTVPCVIAGVPQNEMVGLVPVRAIMLSQAGPVNAVYNSSTGGDNPANTSWWTFMAG